MFDVSWWFNRESKQKIKTAARSVSLAMVGGTSGRTVYTKQLEQYVVKPYKNRLALSLLNAAAQGLPSYSIERSRGFLAIIQEKRADGMASLYAIWKPVSQVRLDGVNYDISVKEREDGRFSVAWVCLKCCEQGPPAPGATTLKQAIDFANIGLRAHHGFFHRYANVLAASKASAAPTGAVAFADYGALERRKAAYECAKAVFEKLCTSHARIHLSNAQGKKCEAVDSLAAACQDWNAVAGEFQRALDAYSDEVSKRAEQFDNGGSKNGWPGHQ